MSNPRPDRPDTLPEKQQDQTYLDMKLTPHRSMSRQQILWLLKAVGVIFLAMSCMAWIIGAWPVIFFCFIEMMLVCLAFIWNFRTAEQYEHIIINQSGFHLTRYASKGAKWQYDLEAFWMRVCFSVAPNQSVKLAVSTHGKTLIIGDFLNFEAKQKLANSLENALLRYRYGA